MNSLIHLTVIVVSFLIFAVTISNILLILIFSIPFTRKISKIGLLKSRHNTVKAYLVTLSIYTVTVTVYVGIFFVFFRGTYLISVIIGLALALIGILVRYKAHQFNEKNVLEYFEKNKKYIQPELVDTYDSDPHKLFLSIQYYLQELNERDE